MRTERRPASPRALDELHSIPILPITALGTASPWISSGGAGPTGRLGFPAGTVGRKKGVAMASSDRKPTVKQAAAAETSLGKPDNSVLAPFQSAINLSLNIFTPHGLVA